MDKKTIAAIVVAIAVMIGYPYYTKMLAPPVPEGVVEGVGVEEVGEAAKADAIGGIKVDSIDGDEAGVAPKGPITSLTESVGAAFKGGEQKGIEQLSAPESEPGADEELVVIDTPLYRAVFTSLGGGVRSFELKNYNQTMKEDSPLVDMARGIGSDLSLQTILKAEGLTERPHFSPSKEKINITGDDSAELVFTWSSPGGVDVEKRYVFKGGDYYIDGKLTISNGGKELLKGTVTTLLTARYDTEYPRYHSGPVAVLSNGEKEERTDSDEKLSGQGKVDWLGLEDKFFLLAIIPKSDMMVGWLGRFRTEDAATTELAFGLDVKPGYQTQFKYGIFMGPKEYKTLLNHGEFLEESIEFGFFAFMAKPTLNFLNFVYKYVQNYGWAIIILTILMKIVFYPLSKKSFKSMKDMQLLAPQMKALRVKYKDEKQKQNKEVMDLYKRHKVNPVGGCLPMVLQIPVFIALYEVLSVAIELRHAPFAFWLMDLSSKDPYYITPLLMGATMFLQQKMTPTAMDPTQAKMMLMMPIVFTFLFLSFPSGLVLYWLLNNILTIAQQWEIHRAKAA